MRASSKPNLLDDIAKTGSSGQQLVVDRTATAKPPPQAGVLEESNKVYQARTYIVTRLYNPQIPSCGYDLHGLACFRDMRFGRSFREIRSQSLNIHEMNIPYD